MSRQSLYRRYRPRRFSEVRGQDHLVTTLRNAVVEDRVGHAYLFVGPRGTGKTTTARILAKALNCTNLSDGEPCGECDSCVTIGEGRSFDVIELDAASHRGIDDVKKIVDGASQSTPGRHRVYILDEAHQLTKEASNALLKTLEEPPEHVVFILATTDPVKLLPTIRSRTQHFEVHLLTNAELRSMVDDVVEDAGLEVDTETRNWAVRAGAGSARDTLSALERAAALGGIPDALTGVEDLVDAFAAHDTVAALNLIEGAVRSGRGPADIGNDLIAHLRLVFLTAMGVPPTDTPTDTAARVNEQVGTMGRRGVTHALEVLGTALVGIDRAADPRVTLELAVMRITQPDTDTSPAALLARIERLEHLLANGGAPTAPAKPASVPTPPAANAAPTVATAPPEAPEHEVRPEPADVPPPATAPSAGGGNGAADAARRALADRRRPTGADTETTTAPKRPAARPAATPATPVASTEPAPAPAAQVPSAAPEIDDPATSDPGGAVATNLTTDTATAAWSRLVTSATNQKIRARLGSARVANVDGATIVVALPNSRALERAEEVRPQMHEALVAEFGSGVSVEFRVDATVATPPEQRPGDRVQPSPDELAPEEDIEDVHALDDANIAPTDDLERIAAVFPGTELVDIEPESAP